MDLFPWLLEEDDDYNSFVARFRIQTFFSLRRISSQANHGRPCYLYLKSVAQRVNRPPTVRDTLVEDDGNTPSQDVRAVENDALLCDYPHCPKNAIGSHFAVKCGLCCRWFHGDCVELSPTKAKSINLSDMEWLCTVCGLQTY
ncbi:hypothetical protein DAPPUDRAFT_244182 [Daphnia pulex]|uniref:PHD-type domain-containing protein n=1 Tax=Daphnia pulex TaxID=6669 RepID=E9GKE1_DAPPU|nr:hypothetical protein DAPPUDRAFT_244182 [Daphnia pulex]|eukprot:EFX79978.1 hypothetical protein DAPPUDRAFT_244182 [Daphnia pulex]